MGASFDEFVKARGPGAPAGGLSDVLTGWQPAAAQKIADALRLREKDYAEDLGFAQEVSSWEGPGEPNVAWLSGMLVPGADLCRASVTGWCGPLTDVPHLIAQCGVSEGGVDLLIDFRVRADCGYTPDGVYAEPDSREAFAMGGNRRDFDAAFFTADAVAWRDALLALPGAQPVNALSAAEMASLSSSPLRVELKLPLTDAAAAAAAEACEAAVARWLGWMQSADEMKRGLGAGAKQTQIYARDTKLRATTYGWLLQRYSATFGEALGKDLAAADAGPLDEAYVGGGS